MGNWLGACCRECVNIETCLKDHCRTVPDDSYNICYTKCIAKNCTGHEEKPEV